MAAYTRRQPTDAQKQAAAERRERFRELAKQVADMSDEQRAALLARVGAVVTCEGRALSAFNSCLILSQCPGASMVGGFQQWKAAGRQVRKGEHGFGIWIPAGGKDKATDAPAAADLEPPADGGSSRPRFLMGTVFDVSQTDPTD